MPADNDYEDEFEASFHTDEFKRADYGQPRGPNAQTTSQEAIVRRAKISGQLRKVMSYLNLTLPELVALTGMSRPTVKAVLEAERNLNKVSRLKLCSALAISEEWLLSENEVDSVGGPLPRTRAQLEDAIRARTKLEDTQNLMHLRRGEEPPFVSKIPEEELKTLEGFVDPKALDELYGFVQKEAGRPEKTNYQKARTEEWGRRLRLLIKSRNLTRADVARGSGLSEQALYNMERGKSWPLEHNWVKLATYFQLSVSMLKGERAMSVEDWAGASKYVP